MLLLPWLFRDAAFAILRDGEALRAGNSLCHCVGHWAPTSAFLLPEKVDESIEHAGAAGAGALPLTQCLYHPKKIHTGITPPEGSAFRLGPSKFHNWQVTVTMGFAWGW